MSVKKDLDDARILRLEVDEVNAIFDAAKKKALEAVGGVRGKRDLPKGVYKTTSGKFRADVNWRGKNRSIGFFDTPEQASTALMSVTNDLDKNNLSVLGKDEVDAIFDTAKTKALESFGGFVPKKRDLPTGVYEKLSGKFQSQLKWGGKIRYVGTFDTPDQASAAYISVKEDLDDANFSGFRADEVDNIFDAAKAKALEASRQ